MGTSSFASFWMQSRKMLGYSQLFYFYFEPDPLAPLPPNARGMLIPAMCRHTNKKTPTQGMRKQQEERGGEALCCHPPCRGAGRLAVTHCPASTAAVTHPAAI